MTLAELATDAPLVVRVLVGLVSGMLVLAGARWYHAGLFLAAFAAGAALVASLLGFAAASIPALADPMVGLIGAVVGGLALGVGTRMAHKVAMVGAGALVGLVSGAVVVQLASAPVWVVPLGLLLGALTFPWIYKQLLKVLTPAVGAAGIAWAVGQPDNALVLVGIWVFGTVVQLVGPQAGHADVDDDEA